MISNIYLKSNNIIRLATVIAVVAIFGGLSLPQAQAGFVETFESGFTDGALLSADANWGTEAHRFVGHDHFTTEDGKGHDGANGDSGFGVFNETSSITGGPSRLHGESTASGSKLTAVFDYKPTSEEAYVGFLDTSGGNYAGVALVNTGARFQSGTGAEPGIVVDSGTDNIVTGDWHRVTFNYEVDGPGTTTTVEVFNYNHSSTFTFHADAAVEAFAPLDKFVLHDTDPGGTQFDNISVSSPSSTSLRAWKANQSGNWNLGTNWNPGSVPNTNQHDVVLGSVIPASRTVFTDLPVTVRSLTFDSSFTYAVAGTGMIILEAGTLEEGTAGISVDQGSHEFQTRVKLLNDTTVDIANGAVLEFDNDLTLNGNILTKAGAGTMLVNNQLTSGPGGVINLVEGMLSGVGTIGGDVDNGGGTISPGASVGALPTAVPEPSTLTLLLLAGWCALVVSGRQRTTPG